MESAWVAVARKARTMLPADTVYGQRQKAAAEVASRIGMTRQSMRNLMTAFDFLESLKETNPEAHADLAKLPSTSVEIYARWAAYDRTGALRHATTAAEEGLSVRRVIAAERRARSKIAAAPEKIAERIVAYLKRSGGGRLNAGTLAKHLKACGIASAAAGTWISYPVWDEFLQALGVVEGIGPAKENRERVEERWFAPIGLLEVGERNLPEAYRKEARTILARAAAACLRFALVVVVCPTDEALREIIGALAAIELSGVENGPRGSMTAGELATPGRNVGGLLFTSLDRLTSDL